MKSQFKPMGMAAAVAAASVGFAGTANATIDAGDLGDLAIIPYYTTMAGYVTGVHITNTSASTQVVKLRLRRGSDSMDALDFNLIMSPFDMWTGTVRMEDNGDIVFRTGDSTCTAPAPNLPGVGFLMPDPADGSTIIDFREGAEEGYIEVIGMGQTVDELQPIAIAAKHPNQGGSGGDLGQPIPADCDRVRDNFFQNATQAGNGVPANRGVLASNLTHARDDAIYDCNMPGVNDGVCPSNYVSTDNVLMVSYFVRDADSGLEMGSKAVHIADFSDDAMMSNQVQFDPAILDEYSYFYPDLDGGSPADTVRDKYDTVIRADLGVDAVLNDWSVNAELNVQTDWVVTFPGQYLMVHRNKYITSLQEDSGVPCNDFTTADPADPYCDFRDIPAVLNIELWDREEQEIIITTPEDELVVSPSVGIDPEIPAILLPFEVNVVKWFGPDTDGEDGVLSSQYSGSIDVGTLGDSGWARLTVTPDDKSSGGGQRVCNDQELRDGYIFGPAVTEAEVDAACVPVMNTNVPMVGFVAWKRSFPDRPDGNYGRMIDHSWTIGS